MRRSILLPLLLGAACSDAAAGARGRRTPPAISSTHVTLFSGTDYSVNTAAWDNSTGVATDYEALDWSAGLFDGQTDVSVCFWAYGRPASSAFRQFITVWGSSDNQMLIAIPSTGADLRWYIASTGADASNYYYTAAGYASVAAWFHTCLVKDNATVAIYKNNSPQTVNTAGTPPETIRASANIMNIGGQSVTAPDTGRPIDDVVIYVGKALTSGEVGTIYGGNPSLVPGYTAWWRFENDFVEEVSQTAATQQNGTGAYGFYTTTLPY